MLETVFRFLFKYERLVFEQGHFVLGATRSAWFVAVVAALAAAYVGWTYARVAALTRRDRIVLLGMRMGLLAVALFALLRPMLLLEVAVPQQNFVGVILDDSRSMQIVDEQGQARSAFVTNEFGGPDGRLLAELSRRFVPRVFRFSTAAERLQSSTDLTFQGTGTRIGDALDQASDELSGLPVAGLVVVTDGADNAEMTLDDTIASLRAQGVPVFTIGVGKDQLARDIQVTRVEAPRRVLQGSSLVLDVVISQVGYAGQTVPLVVEEDGRIVGTEDVTLTGNGESQTVKVHFKASAVGPRTYRFRIPVRDDEDVTQNNQRDALIEVQGGREKILLVDGQPRPEPKFIRLATEKDDNLQVVLLQRMAEATANAPEKYWRGGVSSGDELQEGFPTTREELYQYRALIIGSIEAAAFTAEQQRMIEDFVNVRGGGLLVIGGERGFAEGGWGGTPLANALPVTIGLQRADPTYPPFALTVRPTRAGQAHPATQIADDPRAAEERWKTLPALTAVNDVPVSALKPGATLLLSGADQNGRDRVVLAHQRYGRGKTLALPVQDTWLWQMDASVPVDDQTHEVLWQRLARWLVDSVPNRVMVSAAPDRVERGQPVTLSAEVLDPEYHGINDAQIVARVTAPSGRVEDVVLDWTVEQDGAYYGRFTPAEDGLYRVTVDGSGAARTDIGTGTVSLRVGPSDAEYFDAAMRASLLRRVAEETGGRFFRASETTSLADAISYSGRGVTVVEEKELWDMPIVLLLLLGAMGGEWLYRRAKGLA